MKKTLITKLAIFSVFLLTSCSQTPLTANTSTPESEPKTNQASDRPAIQSFSEGWKTFRSENLGIEFKYPIATNFAPDSNGNCARVILQVLEKENSVALIPNKEMSIAISSQSAVNCDQLDVVRPETFFYINTFKAKNIEEAKQAINTLAKENCKFETEEFTDAEGKKSTTIFAQSSHQDLEKAISSACTNVEITYRSDLSRVYHFPGKSNAPRLQPNSNDGLDYDYELKKTLKFF